MLSGDVIDVGTDLFGAWLVDMSYGRIGTIGRSKIRSFATIEDAQDQVRACLRKRATAPRRIGGAYHVRRVDRNEGWRVPGFDDRLRGWFPPTADAASTGDSTQCKCAVCNKLCCGRTVSI
jgi:hypothetical protein